VVMGFSLIIVIHELGHFLAARWAGIRVLAFAVGFGPALVSFRQGLGWRRGSSERELAEAPADIKRSASPTEYRLNVLPLGGYVKMLGQDDADPSAKSDAPDSFQNAPVWKRMIVISAGVVANLISAVLLFIVVFHLGLKAEPATIGDVFAGKPASKAVASNGQERGVREPGLQPGDRVLAINGVAPDSFNDVMSASVMAGKGATLRFEVERDGVSGPLLFDIKPEIDEDSRMLSIGVGTIASRTIGDNVPPAVHDTINQQLERLGFGQLKSGMTLERVNGVQARSIADLTRAVNAARGEAVSAEFSKPNGGSVTIELAPRAALSQSTAMVSPTKKSQFDHLAGLTPVIRVSKVSKGRAAEKAGLQAGDAIVQVGSVEWPSLPTALKELQASPGKDVRLVVARPTPEGGWREVDLGNVRVSKEGTIGFEFGSTSGQFNVLTRYPSALISDGVKSPSGAQLNLPLGAKIESVGGTRVATLSEARLRLDELIRTSPSGSPVRVELGYSRVLGTEAGVPSTLEWTIPAEEASSIAGLGFESPLPMGLFGTEKTLVKAPGVIPAVKKGVKETHRVMMMTYATIARLFDGTVRIEHLKGPVGIAHVGVIIADRGMVWLLFFMALISVNLAVINFLPLPIVDGGHMIFLIYEQITGKPPPVSVQNGAALAGIVLIGALFLIVTAYNVRDVIRDIFG
jgi:regulator of sigma E protease